MSGLRVLIPYYPSGNDWRAQANQIVQARLRAAGAETSSSALMGADSPGEARNCLADLAELQGIEVLVFNDADTIVPFEQLERAAAMALESPGLVYAYDLYLRLDHWATDMIRQGADPIRLPFEREIHGAGSMGGAAISLEAFRKAQGFDPAYRGWGYEDLAFARRCSRLWPNRRVTGPAWHLWHGGRNRDDSPDDSDPALVQANRDRYHSVASV